MPQVDEPFGLDEVGAAFPHLTLLETLPAGGQASVFKVQDTHGAICALKLYSPSNVVERVDREVAKLQRLGCPYVVRLVGHGTVSVRDRECRWTLTEFVDGVSLRVSTQAGPLEPSACRQLIACVGTAIDAMWQVAVVHRDIKPENIMSRGDGAFVVIDLGLAKHLDAATITRYGMVLGTPPYMSPEQLRGRQALTLKSDIFSLGVTSYEALTGQHPFDWRPDLVLSVRPRPPRDVVAVPQDLNDAIMAMLERTPTRRPSSGRALAGMLEGGV